MEFKNLGCNILDVLGDDRRSGGDMGPFDLSRIYETFSDIPEDNIIAAIMALNAEGLLNVDEESQTLFLSSEGIARIDSLHKCASDFTRRPRQPAFGCCARGNQKMDSFSPSTTNGEQNDNR